MNRFSTDIARGDICRARRQDRFEKTVRRPFSKCDKGTRENNHQIIFFKCDEGTREEGHQTLFEVPQWRG